MISANNIYWLAGILEGEGCFHCASGKWNSYTPVISLVTTDRDIIDRVKKLMGTHHAITVNNPLSYYKTAYQYRVTGNLAVQWMMTLLPLMGKRRKEKMEYLLYAWRFKKSLRRIAKG